jgi:dTDP-4-dehydrorhamnose 3,5-epimerase
MIEGIVVTPLKCIQTPKGDVFHALKASENGYSGFGEAYFSTVHEGDVKGWKKHKLMTLNLVVPVGAIKFVVHDDREMSNTYREFYEIEMSLKNYNRLTVPPGVWLAFQGKSSYNMLLNIASIPHDPSEAENKAIDFFPYSWRE